MNNLGWIVLSHAALTTGLIVVTGILHWITLKLAGSESRGWLNLPSGTELPLLQIWGEGIAPWWAIRLQELYDDVRGHSIIQLKVYMDLQITYYASTLIWTVLAATASVSGVFVIKEGWNGSNSYLQNAAITITLLMTFWQAIPKMLSMSANIASAKKCYLSCAQLGNEILSFARQPHDLTANLTAVQMETDFINKADKRFGEIRNLNFDIDTTQAPDFRKAIQDEIKTK